MKKVLLGLGLVISGSLMAQKPASDDSHFSLEGLINYNANDGMNWTAPSLRMRYFVTDNIAARVQLGIGNGTMNPSKESHTYYEMMDGTGGSGTVDMKSGAWNSMIGAEYHLTGNDKMSPYFFGGVMFGKGKYQEDWASASNLSGDYAYDPSIESAQIMMGSSSFGFGLGAGLDYYVAENLYLGLELGYMSSSVSYDESTATVNLVGVATPVMAVEGPSKMSYSGTGAANASIRIGWRF